MKKENATVKHLSEYGNEYAILYELGTGLGAEISQLLKLKVEDVCGKESLSMPVGPKHCTRTFALLPDLIRRIDAYVKGRKGILFVDDGGIPVMEDEARQVLEACGIDKPFLHILMGRYYMETDDIRYPMFFMDLPTPEATLEAIC